MGQLWLHHCDTCKYQAEISGGEDAGMACVTQTVYCAQCQQLDDAITACVGECSEPDTDLESRPLTASGPDWVECPPRCPRDASHPVTAWTAPGPCPRQGCPGTVSAQPDGLICLWD